MWELARPLIEDWMMENMGPEARIRDATERLLDGLERLPKLISDMEETVGAAARNGIRLDPASLETLARNQGRGSGWQIWAAATLAAIVAIVIFD